MPRPLSPERPSQVAASQVAKRALTQMGTAGTIGMIGDGLIQYYERQGSQRAQHQLEHDWGRTARLCAYRTAHAPVCDAIWRRFDAAAAARQLSGGRAVAFKLCCDQAMLNPTFTACFYLSQSALERRTAEEAVERLRHGFWPTVFSGVQFGCVVHSITFGVVPVNYRIAWNSITAVFWTAYISHMNQGLRLQEEVRQHRETSGNG